MVTAVVGALGGLSICAWLVVSWLSARRQPWLLAPLAVAIIILVAFGLPWWALLPTFLLGAGVFATLVIGAREAPALRSQAPDAPLSTERWAAAVAAPFRAAAAEPWDVVVRPNLRFRYRRMLSSEWGVTDRASLLAAVSALWEELHGHDSADLVIDLRAGTALPRGGGESAPRRGVALTLEEVARLREVTGVDPNTQTVVIGAFEWWRSVHLVRLVCAGATLNWISPAETQAMLRRVASDLQRRYASWAELAQAFHAGYLLWRDGQRYPEPDRLWTALGLLVHDPQSPWLLLPWDMPLERAVTESGLPNAHI